MMQNHHSSVASVAATRTHIVTAVSKPMDRDCAAANKSVLHSKCNTVSSDVANACLCEKECTTQLGTCLDQLP